MKQEHVEYIFKRQSQIIKLNTPNRSSYKVFVSQIHLFKGGRYTPRGNVFPTCQGNFHLLFPYSQF